MPPTGVSASRFSHDSEFAEPARLGAPPMCPAMPGWTSPSSACPRSRLANRAGARHGPAQIREMSRLIRRVNAPVPSRPFDLCQVADVGDVPKPARPGGQHPEDSGVFRHIACRRRRAGHGRGTITITLPILRALAAEGPVGRIHFDAHADTLDTLLGQDQSWHPLPSCRRRGAH